MVTNVIKSLHMVDLLQYLYGNRYYVLYVHFGYTNLEIACYGPHSILSRVRPCMDYIVQQESSTASLVKTVTTHVGETGRTLKSRLSEHRRNCGNED